jgi:integrase/recombinase XerD
VAVAAARTALDLVADWREYLENHGYRASTIRHYPAIARDWISWLERQGGRYDRAEFEHADGFIQYLRKERNLDAWSIRCQVSPLRTFYKWLRRRHYATDNPFESLDPIRAKPKLVRPLTEEQVKALIDAAPTVQRRALWEVFYSTGGRISSILAIKMEDLQLDARRIIFRFQKGGGEHVVPLTKTAAETLGVYLEWRDEALKARGVESQCLWIGVFGREAVRNQTVRRWLKEDALKAGIAERIHPHRIRHSAATHMLEHGADLRVVQELLGHTSLDMTAQYAKVAIAHLQQKVDQLHPRGDVFAERETPKFENVCENPACTKGADGKPAKFKTFTVNRRFCTDLCRYQAKTARKHKAAAGGEVQTSAGQE